MKIRHIVNNNHINEQEVQCKLTTLCLRYLSLPCFVSGYDDCQRQENAREGWFSFQDYACSYWHFHIETFIRECNGLRDTASLMDFAGALRLFFQTHREHLTHITHSEIEHDLVKSFRGHSFYGDLFLVWNHIFTHQKASFDDRNKVGIAQIDEALHANRTVLEDFAPSDHAIQRDSIEDYYGPNLFKCSRILCRFFHVGYNSKQARENHDNRHNRPYPCPFECRNAPLGFTTKKDQEKHVRFYHPEMTDRPSIFERPIRGQENARFTCSLCSSRFTRKENLRGHERTHFGSRPYQCSKCGKAFTRLHDCNRHERNNSCKVREGEATNVRLCYILNFDRYISSWVCLYITTEFDNV